MAVLFAAAVASPLAAQPKGKEVGELYADVKQCADVLTELNTADVVDQNALAVATHVCHASRMADHLAREAERIRSNSNEFGSTRGLSEIVAASDDEMLLATKEQFQDAQERRDIIIEEYAQIDPHEANDLLRRLLGPAKDEKG